MKRISDPKLDLDLDLGLPQDFLRIQPFVHFTLSRKIAAAACQLVTMIAFFLLGSLVAYILVTIIYRVHIHPLSKFPGPRLAAVTGLYEVFLTTWGTGSFEEEINRMHEEYGKFCSVGVLTCPFGVLVFFLFADFTGPVVRITPDEVHVQEQFHDPRHADNWIKGSKRLQPSRYQSGFNSPRFQIRKRSMSRVRSILQVEVHQIIRGLVQKHQVHRVFSWRVRSFAMIPSPLRIPVDSPGESDLEDGHQPASGLSSISKHEPRSQIPLEYRSSDPGLWKAAKVNDRRWYSADRRPNQISLKS